MQNVKRYTFSFCGDTQPSGRGTDHICTTSWMVARSISVPNYSLTSSFQPHYGPGFDSASNRNEYQEYFLEVKAVGA